MPINQRPGSYPHVRWLDLKRNGVMVESAVLKEDRIGNLYFIEIAALDNIDKGRLVKILTNRNARSFELWDLMSQITLNNGVNALSYFHQLVKVITPAGIVMNPKTGAIGTDVRPAQQIQHPPEGFYNQQQPVQQAAPPVQQAQPSQPVQQPVQPIQEQVKTEEAPVTESKSRRRRRNTTTDSSSE